MIGVMNELREQGIRLREKILEKIVEYIEIHGYTPTVREIGALTGLKSTSTVQHHLEILREEGKIETDAGLGVPRAIRIPGYKFTKVAG